MYVDQKELDLVEQITSSLNFFDFKPLSCSRMNITTTNNKTCFHLRIPYTQRVSLSSFQHAREAKYEITKQNGTATCERSLTMTAFKFSRGAGPNRGMKD